MLWTLWKSIFNTFSWTFGWTYRYYRRSEIHFSPKMELNGTKCVKTRLKILPPKFSKKEKIGKWREYLFLFFLSCTTFFKDSEDCCYRHGKHYNSRCYLLPNFTSNRWTISNLGRYSSLQVCRHYSSCRPILQQVVPAAVRNGWKLVMHISNFSKMCPVGKRPFRFKRCSFELKMSNLVSKVFGFTRKRYKYFNGECRSFSIVTMTEAS